MSYHQPIVGEFGAARVIFARPGQRIPPELQIEFELLRQSEREPALLEAWSARLSRLLRAAAQPRPWNLLRVAPNMERKVCEALKDAGLQVYVPVEKYRPGHTWKARTRPLIPGYIFALLPDDDALDTARKNYAVRELMCRDGRPLEVPALDVGALVLFEAWGAFDDTNRKTGGRYRGRRGRKGQGFQSRWQHGQRVKINEGVFAGFVGQIMRANREDRVHVLVSIFGRVTPTEVDDDWLEEAE